VNPYRRRIFDEMSSILSTLGPIGRALDVGAGDGWFAMTLQRSGITAELVAIDVMARPQAYHPVQMYDGNRLPFHDHTYDLVYAVDVVHHARDPAGLLADMARCTSRYLLLKDHTWNTKLGWLALMIMDEIGNRRFGVPSVYKYQHRWEWETVMRAAGLERIHQLHPLACHTGVLGKLTNGLQFLSLWQQGKGIV
jgi:SAM-dependent methyltransferase